MANVSECSYKDFELLLGEELPPDLSCIGGGNECTFVLPAFAYPSDTTDEWRNDFAAPLVMINNKYSTPELYLEVMTDCVWTEVAELTSSNTYGTYSSFSNGWIGYKLDWYLVYNVNGAGTYRLREEKTNIQTTTVSISYGYRYDLKLFTSNQADGTVKMTYKVGGGKMPNILKPKRMINYGTIKWEREMRLPNSFFGFESSEYTIESTRYKNGGQKQIKNLQIQTISFHSKKLPYTIHEEIRSTALQCGNLHISDYNLSNPKKYYDHFRVKLASDYSPTWTTYNSFSPVQLEFNPYYENLQRKEC